MRRASRVDFDRAETRTRSRKGLCEGCIVHHTKAAKAAGATLAEIQDTLDVCVLMGGGPATVYGKKALDTYNA